MQRNEVIVLLGINIVAALLVVELAVALRLRIGVSPRLLFFLDSRSLCRCGPHRSARYEAEGRGQLITITRATRHVYFFLSFFVFFLRRCAAATCYILRPSAPRCLQRSLRILRRFIAKHRPPMQIYHPND